ncbi:MAG: twin-arginine translocase TatA/TatE family subunit [Solirubrobacteraceae bacterium]
MGIENPVHLIFIAVVALVVLGPKRLPELARALGHGIREFRDAVSNPGGEDLHAPVVEPAVSQTPIAPQPPAAEPAVTHTPIDGPAVSPPHTIDSTAEEE